MSEVDDVLVEQVFEYVLDKTAEYLQKEEAEELIALVKASQPDHSELIAKVDRVMHYLVKVSWDCTDDLFRKGAYEEIELLRKVIKALKGDKKVNP